jgi:hypothetical protein
VVVVGACAGASVQAVRPRPTRNPHRVLAGADVWLVWLVPAWPWIAISAATRVEGVTVRPCVSGPPLQARRAANMKGASVVARTAALTQYTQDERPQQVPRPHPWA